MDRNTIIGLVLIFLIFIGSSVYNNSRVNNLYKKAVTSAEASFNKGEFETARTEYINALNIRPNQPDVIAKLNELNLKLGIIPANQAVERHIKSTPARINESEPNYTAPKYFAGCTHRSLSAQDSPPFPVDPALLHCAPKSC